MITLILISLAAIFKAVADTLDDHFDTSIFRNKNRYVWDANYSKVKAWWITGYKFDPWHICNSLMIFCFIGAGVFSQPINFFELHIWGGLAFIFYGVIFNIIFGLFYSKLLRK